MKARIILKQISEGVYQESEEGTEYIRNDEFQLMSKDILRENSKLRKRLANKELQIEELKQQLLCMKDIADRVESNDYKRAYRMFDSCAGKCGASRDKCWVIDVDYETIKESDVQDVIDYINNCQPLDTEKIIAKIPTVNGVHLITKPFNLLEFRRKYKESEINVHKNNPTLLFYGGKN